MQGFKIDGVNPNQIQAIINRFTDPLTKVQTLHLIQLCGVWHWLQLPDGHPSEQDREYHCRSIIRVGEYFAAQQQLSLAKKILHEALLTINRIPREASRVGITLDLIGALVAAKDFATAENNVRMAEPSIRFWYGLELAHAHFCHNHIQDAKRVLVQIEPWLVSEDVNFDQLDRLGNLLIDMGMVDRGRFYLDRAAPIIKQGEQSGDEFGHQDWIRLCVDYARIGDLKRVREISEASGDYRHEALCSASTEFAKRGFLKEAEAVIADFEDDAYDELTKAKIHLAIALHDQGHADKCAGLLDAIQKSLRWENSDTWQLKSMLSILTHLAPAYQYIGDMHRTQAAIADIHIVFGLYEDSLKGRLAPEVLIAHATYEYADCLARMGYLDDARAMLEQELAVYGPVFMGVSWLTLCFAFAQRGYLAEALKLLSTESLSSFIFKVLSWRTSPINPGQEFAIDWNTIILELVKIGALEDPDWESIVSLLNSAS